MANLTVSFKFTPDSPWLPRQQNLHLQGRGVFEVGPSNAANEISPPTLSGCHGNENWDKISYSSASARDICKIFASIWGFLGLGHRILPKNF